MKLINYIKENYNFYILMGLTLAFHFVSMEAFLIGITILSLFYICIDMCLNRKNPIDKKYMIIIPLLLYLVIGIVVELTQYEYTTHNILRDIFYHTNSLAVIILVLSMFSNNIKKEQIFWSILIVGTIMGICTLLKVKEFKDAGFNVSYMNLRSISNAGYIVNFLSVISFLFIKKYKYITIPLSVFNLYMSIIAFSRVGIILLACLILFMSIYYFIFSKHKFSFTIMILVLCCILAILYFQTTYIKDTISRFTNTIDELNPNQDWTESTNVQHSWRGYEVYLIIEQFKVDNIITKIFGHGFGAYIYTEIPITVMHSGTQVVETIHELPVFHNGYFGCLFKCGIVGLLIYISFIITLYIYSFKYIKDKKDLFLNLALITYVALASYVVMGLFYKEVWFPLVFLFTYLIKYHMDKRDEMDTNDIDKEVVEEVE